MAIPAGLVLPFLLCIFLFIVPAVGNCVSGWVLYEGTCYNFPNSQRSWTSCNTYCPTLNGGVSYMLCIPNADVNTFVKDNMRGDTWIGLSDTATEGTFKWNTGCTSSFTNWNTNEPNNSGGSEDYAEIEGSGKWNDLPNTVTSNYCACQYIIPTAPPTARPSPKPTAKPTHAPSAAPSAKPTAKPTARPTAAPTARPSAKPTTMPSASPTAKPTASPTAKPTASPSAKPTANPTASPTAAPTAVPTTSAPTANPSVKPSTAPTAFPTANPTATPTGKPTAAPTAAPTATPSAKPSSVPTAAPTATPTVCPTARPTARPTAVPSALPTSRPSSAPTGQPSSSPTAQPTRQPSRQPTSQPTAAPTRQPSSQPTRQPTGQPSAQPSRQPSGQPTAQPSRQPSSQPTRQPTGQPSSAPTGQPTARPSRRPTGQPTAAPTGQPTRQPTAQPSRQPSTQPTGQPTSQPSTQPTRQPSGQPSRQPTGQPTAAPTGQPTRQPTAKPSTQPSGQPSRQPSTQPSSAPTRQPTAQPSRQPTSQPTTAPSTQPSRQPTTQPSRQPTAQPTRQPTSQPSLQPTRQPSTQPSRQPTAQPTTVPSGQPTRQPSGQPTSQPTRQPTGQPTLQPSAQPSSQPSNQPTRQPTGQPTAQPSRQPTAQPSRQPTAQPSAQPSASPTAQPSTRPTGQLTTQPSAQPTGRPSRQPSGQPTAQPLSQPSARPSAQPTTQPSRQPSTQPTRQPTAQPTTQPSRGPSSQPSVQPTARPSSQPTGRPTAQPSEQPSAEPSVQPSSRPSTQPSTQPSAQPTSQPTGEPTSQPSTQPSSQPTSQPSFQPSSLPTGQPSTQPTAQPTGEPTSQPSAQPTGQPSAVPSAQPTIQPTSRPSFQPSAAPTSQPSTVPTVQPSSQPSTQPSCQPSAQPSAAPTSCPSSRPSAQPSSRPTAQPSGYPTGQPSTQPSGQPSNAPSSIPTSAPTAAATQKVYVMLGMIAGLWLPALLCVAVDVGYGYYGADKRSTRKVEPAAAGRAPQNLQPLFRYVESTVPRIFRLSGTPWQRLWAAVKDHHVACTALLHEHRRERLLAVATLVTTLTLMLFLTAVFFDAADPNNDRTCGKYHTESACLARRSAFDHTRSYCRWVEEGRWWEHGRCKYDGESLSATALFYIAVVALAVASIASLPIMHLLRILSAPTALRQSDAYKVSYDDGAEFPIGTAGVPAPRKHTSSRPTVSLLRRLPSLSHRDTTASVTTRTVPAAAVAEARDLALSCVDTMREQARARQAHAQLQESALRTVYRKAHPSRPVTAATAAASVATAEPIAEDSIRDAEAVETNGTAFGDVPNLVEDVLCQRWLLQGCPECEEFDAEWGTYHDSDDGTLQMRPGTMASIEQTQTEAAVVARCVTPQLRHCNTQQAGLEILHLFMLDLLGRDTVAARICREKFSEDFRDHRSVSVWEKCAAAAVLLGLNAYFVFYVIDVGFLRGPEWQYRFLLCCAILVLVYLLLFETVECAWLHFAVPQYVRGEVSAAAAKLTALVHTLAEPLRKLPTDACGADPDELSSVRDRIFLNAPAHLFVSVKLARSFPQLLESLIVSSYTDHLPGAVGRAWPHHSTDYWRQPPTSKLAAMFPTAVARWTFALNALLALPFSRQRMALRVVQPVLFCGLCMLLHHLADNTLGLALLTLTLVTGVLLAVWRTHCLDDNRIAKVAPINESPQRSGRAVSVLFDERGATGNGYLGSPDPGLHLPPVRVRNHSVETECKETLDAGKRKQTAHLDSTVVRREAQHWHTGILDGDHSVLPVVTGLFDSESSSDYSVDFSSEEERVVAAEWWAAQEEELRALAEAQGFGARRLPPHAPVQSVSRRSSSRRQSLQSLARRHSSLRAAPPAIPQDDGYDTPSQPSSSSSSGSSFAVSSEAPSSRRSSSYRRDSRRQPSLSQRSIRLSPSLSVSLSEQSISVRYSGVDQSSVGRLALRSHRGSRRDSGNALWEPDSHRRDGPRRSVLQRVLGDDPDIGLSGAGSGGGSGVRTVVAEPPRSISSSSSSSGSSSSFTADSWDSTSDGGFDSASEGSGAVQSLSGKTTFPGADGI